MKYAFILMLFLLFVVVNSVEFCFADSLQNHSIFVEVDLLDFNSGVSNDEVSIDIPDYIDLGNVSPDDLVSDEVSFSINNTGKVNITVFPQLKDNDEEIFKCLFFRNYLSSSVYPEQAIPRKIGEYSVDIDKPSTGKTSRSKNVYIKLNLTDFDGTITEDVDNYRSELMFIALPRV